MSTSQFNKPKQFDRHLIVIGAGAAGLAIANIAATGNTKVTLIEANKMGGERLNTGCVPSKSLIRTARMVSYMERGREFALKSMTPDFEFSDVMERVQKTIQTIEPRDSIERYEQLGVEVIQGRAKFVSPWAVDINGKTLSAKSIVIATGGRPFVPSIPGLRDIGCLTSDSVWGLRDKPKRMVVIGGGAVGCELSQSFARLGVEVTQIEVSPRLLMSEDKEVSAWVERSFARDGVSVLTNCKIIDVEQVARDKVVVCEKDDKRLTIPCDEILVAVGRAANTGSLGLEAIGVELEPQGTVKVDQYLRTETHKHIMACGDVAGPYQFTHAATHQAKYIVANSVSGMFKKRKVDYRVLPWATFTDPEVARVGLNEQEAKEQNVPYDMTGHTFKELDRAITDEETAGFVKVLTKPGKDTILGVTIVGCHASDVIAEYVLAMHHGLGLNKVLETIHIYPSLAEVNQCVANDWKKNHALGKRLKWSEKFHQWRLGWHSKDVAGKKETGI